MRRTNRKTGNRMKRQRGTVKERRREVEGRSVSEEEVIEGGLSRKSSQLQHNPTYCTSCTIDLTHFEPNMVGF